MTVTDVSSSIRAGPINLLSFPSFPLIYTGKLQSFRLRHSLLLFLHLMASSGLPISLYGLISDFLTLPNAVMLKFTNSTAAPGSLNSKNCSCSVSKLFLIVSKSPASKLLEGTCVLTACSLPYIPDVRRFCNRYIFLFEAIIQVELNSTLRHFFIYFIYHWQVLFTHCHYLGSDEILSCVSHQHAPCRKYRWVSGYNDLFDL